ncbi:MAG TPA: alpha/beta hydrolase [Dehalococcoidia bacterium]|nr:alpha/beta hydrolase [Dehalococcoidia bacterium]
MRAESRFAQLGQIRMHYWDWGGTGQPVLFVHANGFHGAVWSPIAEALLPEYRSIAVDVRGHGDSDKPDQGYEWTQLASDIGELLHALDVRDAVGIGHSLGGGLTVICAALYPGAISRAVLIDPVITSGPPTSEGVPINPLAEAARKRRHRWASKREAFEHLRTRATFAGWREDVLWLYVDYGLRDSPEGGVELKCSGEIEARIFEETARSPAFSMLGALEGHSLILLGEASYVGEAIARGAAGRMRSVELDYVPGTTHFLVMERPDDVASRIRAFLEQRV